MIDVTIPLEKLNTFTENTMLSQLGIKMTLLGEDFIEGTMPVDHRTHQPVGLLHGGASAALIESLGSMGSSLLVDSNKYNVVGIEINVNHMRGIKEGAVTGRATVIHAGKRTHVWQVDIKDEKNRLIAAGRLTVMVVEK
ncbi:hotdog fold thioesterase [Crocinitomix sp.]|nr:hotdog fold thioesterase [Crocinitomix sp.]